MQLPPWRSQNRHALTMGSIWQAEAIIRLAKLLLKQPSSSEARIALARGIVECAKAIEAHERMESGASGPAQPDDDVRR